MYGGVLNVIKAGVFGAKIKQLPYRYQWLVTIREIMKQIELLKQQINK